MLKFFSKQESSIDKVGRNGKIGLATLDIIHEVLLKTLQYILSQILQTGWPVILDIVVYRHLSLPYKVVTIILNIGTAVLLATTLIHHICNIFNLYHSMLICKHQDIISCECMIIETQVIADLNIMSCVKLIVCLQVVIAEELQIHHDGSMKQPAKQWNYIHCMKMNFYVLYGSVKKLLCSFMVLRKVQIK